jgi:arylsulfatase A
MRVPTVMCWPGHLPANTQCNELASTLDLLPTIANLVNEEMPGDRVIDGKDITSLLKDPHSSSPHEYFYY